MKKPFHFLLIPSAGDAIRSLTDYSDADLCLATARALARRVLQSDPLAGRDDIALAQILNPTSVEFHVIRSADRTSIFSEQLERCEEDHV